MIETALAYTVYMMMRPSAEQGWIYNLAPVQRGFPRPVNSQTPIVPKLATPRWMWPPVRARP
jgi:hypothetical protein